jgi:hypothetical protein
MTLDLNQLHVDSFATSAAGDPSQWGAAGESISVEGGAHADTFVACVATAALTDVYPCKTTR